MDAPMDRNRWGLYGFIAILICGVALRLIWPDVMEYKEDEQWLFGKCMTVGRTEPIPTTAMHASVGPNNPAAPVSTITSLVPVLIR